MNTDIQVRSSSSDEVYTVNFKVENGMTSITCNCKAGQMKMLCKHRLNLLDGDVSAIVDESDKSVLPNVLGEIDQEKIANIFTELEEVEQEMYDLNIINKKLKKEVGIRFSDGF